MEKRIQPKGTLKSFNCRTQDAHSHRSTYTDRLARSRSENFRFSLTQRRRSKCKMNSKFIDIQVRAHATIRCGINGIVRNSRQCRAVALPLPRQSLFLTNVNDIKLVKMICAHVLRVCVCVWLKSSLDDQVNYSATASNQSPDCRQLQGVKFALTFSFFTRSFLLKLPTILVDVFRLP